MEQNNSSSQGPRLSAQPGPQNSHSRLIEFDDLLETLRSTQVPDFKRASESLSEAEKDYRRIDGEIKRLEAELASLKMEREVTNWRVARYKSLLAPIRKLPPEVLAIVFEFFCSEGARVLGNRNHISSAPMKISFVCAGWRELVRSMPKLWSFLYFGGFSSQRDSLPLGNLQLAISTHLELSQQHTLDFEVALYAPIKPEIFEFLLKPIVANANRWRDVAFRLPIDIFLRQDLAPVKGNLSLLRKLALSSNGNSWDASALDAFEIAPSLRSLCLITGVPTNLRLPWKQISNHTIEHSSLSTALRALSSTTEATHVTLLQCDQLESTSTQNIIIHSLHSLSIVINRKNPGFYYWFKWLTLPRLNHLEILGDESLAPESSSHVPEYFSSFLSRSSCTITSLSLVGLSIGDVNTVSILSSLTSLSTLTIHELKYWKTNKMISANLLNALTVDLGSGFSPTKAKICRHLEHLDLCFHGTFSAKCVIDAINSRWIPVAKYAALLGVDSIKSVRIQVIMSKDAKYFDMKELDEAMGLCKAAGLKFYSSPKFLT